MVYEDLKGKKVLVTGSSSGIGQATTVAFSEQGCFVGVHYFRTKQGGEKTLEQVRNNSDGILLCADMRDQEQVGKMVERFAKEADGIDVLVNNAGSLIDRQTFETGTVEYHDDVYATNVRSIFLAARSALPYLKKSKGNIINIGSIAGHTGEYIAVTGGLYMRA
jgi:3-oxoacyl-[acyl-carrier protein] reductase